MINENIKDYVKVYNNFLDKDFCEGVIKELQNNNWETHSFYLPMKNEFITHIDDLSVSFNRKEEKCDHIHTIFDGKKRGIPVLSIVGALNEDYEGGEFIMWETEKIELPQGSIMIFPSNFMYPHKVMPVTKGTRYSYVSWTY